jgi:hypothetical protein
VVRVHFGRQSSPTRQPLLGLDVQRRHDLDFLQAVPVELWGQIPGPLSDWCRTEAPVWQDEVRQRIGDIEEIARWVRELKERPRTE